VPSAAPEFAPATVAPVLTESCVQAGLDSQGAELVRLGENAIYRLAGAPIVVRIARSADRMSRVNKELCIARWLARGGVPAIRLVDEIGQPLLVDGHPVSFWLAVSGGSPEPTHADLARLLAGFHALPDCPCELPAFDPIGPSRARLGKAAAISDADREFLYRRCAELAVQYHDLSFALPVGPIHGDAHTRNLLTDNGRVVLSDFETAAIGPREWDLMPTAIAVDRYGLPEESYREFAGSYGFDVREWSGYPVLREVRTLTMTTWIMQNAGESSAAAREFALRVDSLRERDFTRAFNFF
jgi:hypothetical protein